MPHRRLLAFALALLALPLLAQEPYEAFMTKFEEAVKADNYATMKDLVVKNQPFIFDGYMLYEREYCSAVANQSDEDKAARVAILEKLVTFVKQEFKDNFYVERLAWVKALSAEQAAKRVEVTTLVYDGATAFRRGEKSSEKKDWTDAREKFAKVIPIAKEIGDVYWQIDGNVWLAGVAEKLEERFETAYHYKAAMEIAREGKQTTTIAKYDLGGKLKRAARDGLRDDLIDVTIPVAQSKVKYASTIEKMAADAATPGGAESRGAGGAGGPKGAMPSNLPPMANKHTMRVEWADAEKAKYAQVAGRPMLTPSIRANGPWFMWYSIDVAPGAGSKTTVVPGEHLMHNEKGKILFDSDGAGKSGDERIKVALGKPDVATFKARQFPDGSKVDVHHLLMEQPRNFTINGVGLTLKAGGPNDPIRLALQGATAVSSKFDGYEITVYDDSCNGDFSNYGDDSMVITKAKVSRIMPLSRYVYLGDLLFEMKIDPNGQNMRFKPYDGPVALLQFDYVANTMPAFMIVEGLNENAQSFFNLMDCKSKPMWVPPGEYKFRNGYFSFGEGEKRETIVVETGKATSFKVSEGTLNKLEMGGAKAPGFSCTWKAEIEKDKGKVYIRLKGKEIKIFGCAGEEYKYFYTGVFRPQVKMRIGKDGAVFYDKQMKAPASEDVSAGKAWPDVLFFPKDMEAEKTAAGDAFVELSGDYPKLGKITSTPTQVQ